MKELATVWTEVRLDRAVALLQQLAWPDGTIDATHFYEVGEKVTGVKAGRGPSLRAALLRTGRMAVVSKEGRTKRWRYQLFPRKDARPAQTERVLNEVREERRRQDEQWGQVHDDQHTVDDWLMLIDRYRPCVCRDCKHKNRKALVQVAALAVAAIESLDRSK